MKHEVTTNNGHTLTGPDDTGFVVICFAPGVVDAQAKDLVSAAIATHFEQLIQLLQHLLLNAKPLVTSFPAEMLLRKENTAQQSTLPPLRSLTQYWRMNARSSKIALEEIVSAFLRLPGVELAYKEKTTSEPAGAATVFSGLQHYLDAAPIGIDVRWVHQNYPTVDGRGLHFVDVEKGWLPEHEDLPPTTLIFNDNHLGIDPDVGNHGAAVLGIVAGLENGKGVTGIVPKLESISIASTVSAGDPHRVHLSEALSAALKASPRPHVVLIEVQSSVRMLPVETDQAVFDAIRLLVASGISVVEAGGNGGLDLDVWAAAHSGQKTLDRSVSSSDSGAILVGAGKSDLHHNRWIGRSASSNFGQRVDCYAWGENIVTTGKGPDKLPGSAQTSYTKTFSGTSGAAAIIAGAALLLHGVNAVHGGKRLKPQTVRTLLSAPSLGTSQGRAVAGHIGSMPDLRRIIQSHWPSH